MSCPPLAASRPAGGAVLVCWPCCCCRRCRGCRCCCGCCRCCCGCLGHCLCHLYLQVCVGPAFVSRTSIAQHAWAARHDSHVIQQQLQDCLGEPLSITACSSCPDCFSSRVPLLLFLHPANPRPPAGVGVFELRRHLRQLCLQRLVVSAQEAVPNKTRRHDDKARTIVPWTGGPSLLARRPYLCWTWCSLCSYSLLVSRPVTAATPVQCGTATCRGRDAVAG